MPTNEDHIKTHTTENGNSKEEKTTSLYHDDGSYNYQPKDKFSVNHPEALDSLRNKMPSMTINNIILDLEQTSIYGSDIVLCMNNQIDFLRDKKILEIKEKINKLPNQISIISVLFIIPLLLTLILGPFFINFFMK